MEDEKGRCDKGGERKGDKTTKTDLMPRKVLTSSVPCTCVHTHIRTYIQCSAVHMCTTYSSGNTSQRDVRAGN